MAFLKFPDGKPVVPFIGTQRLVHLQAPPHLRMQCLEPAAFRVRRRAAKAGASANGLAKSG